MTLKKIIIFYLLIFFPIFSQAQQKINIKFNADKRTNKWIGEAWNGQYSICKTVEISFDGAYLTIKNKGGNVLSHEKVKNWDISRKYNDTQEKSLLYKCYVLSILHGTTLYYYVIKIDNSNTSLFHTISLYVPHLEKDFICHTYTVYQSEPISGLIE